MILMRYVICFLLCCLLACKKKEDTLNLPRQFMPAGDISVRAADTIAILSWKAAVFTTKGVGYTVEISQDSLFTTPGQSFHTDTTAITIHQEALVVRKVYYARVRTEGKDTATSSHWLYSKGFAITGEQLFLPVADSNLIDKSVILYWKPTAGLTKLTFVTGGVTRTIPLTAEQSMAGKLQVDTLSPATTYTVEIFKADASKGILNITTRAAVATGPNVVDLSGYTGIPAILQDTLPKVPAGAIIILRKGERYVISQPFDISGAISFVSEISFDARLPQIYFENNFNFAAGSVVDSVVFKDISLRSNSYTGRYVVNANKVATVGKVVFESCRIEVFRGVFRLQTSAAGGTQVGDLLVRNCVVDSIADYGLVHVSNAACAIQHITVQNSTVYKAEKLLVSAQASNALVLSNCTFSEVPQGGGTVYLVDYNANNVMNGISLNNCIVGVGLNNGGSVTVRGIRAGTGTTISAGGSYTTSDYVAAANPIAGLTVYTGKMTDLFSDPYNGNFKLIDGKFAGSGTAGDPRWF